MKNKRNHIRINGHSYKVTKEVYKVYIKEGRKMRYLERELKTERIVIDNEKQRVKIIASKEDSLKRLTEEKGRQFAD